MSDPPTYTLSPPAVVASKLPPVVGFPTRTVVTADGVWVMVLVLAALVWPPTVTRHTRPRPKPPTVVHVMAV
jgi:hypothetical protein